MNKNEETLKIEIDYNKFTEWIEAGIDTPFIITINLPEIQIDNKSKSIKSLCKCNNPTCTCTCTKGTTCTCTCTSTSTSNVHVNVHVPEKEIETNPVSNNLLGINSVSKYVLDENEDKIVCKLPKGVKNIPSFIRNINLLKVLNKVHGFNFKLCNAKDGFRSLTAIDEDEKAILITCSDISFIINSKTQSMIEHFKDIDYNTLVWCDEFLYTIKRNDYYSK